jgi:hypothetical protein
MSWDFVQDALDSLEKDNCQYVLLVGKCGYKRTDIFCQINSRKDAEKFLSALKQTIEKKFPDKQEGK